MKILVPLCFVARASRRAASTVVSTFFSAVRAIRLELQHEINPLRRSGQRWEFSRTLATRRLVRQRNHRDSSIAKTRLPAC
jgi:hypothetical protein